MTETDLYTWQLMNEVGLSQDHATVKALSDGYVSKDEYESAWAAELTCYEDLGYSITHITLNKLNSWERQVSFVPPENSPTDLDDAMWRCGAENTGFLVLTRQTNSSHEDRIDPPLLADAQTCLNALETPPNGTEVNVHELLDTTNDPSGTMDCLLTSWRKLYPDDQMWHGVDVGIQQ